MVVDDGLFRDVLTPDTSERISVLLVEDNLPDARLVQELLRESPAPGFEVSCVAQLSDAISELSESNPE
jgi:hypothetical protein